MKVPTYSYAEFLAHKLVECQQQRGELLEALEDLLEAIPNQNKGDWWPDELTHAVRDAKAAIAKADGE